MMHQQQRTQQIRRWVVWFLLVGAMVVSCMGGTTIGWAFANIAGGISFNNTPQFAQLATPSPLPTATSLPVRSSANELEAQVEDVYRRVGPGVVNITSRSFELDFFLRPVPREGTGSGFFYDSNGHIVTNYHVIEDSEELNVTLEDGRNLVATIVGTDPSNDLAVIKVDLPAAEIPVVPIVELPDLQVGQFVIAIGNPFGLERTLTLGVVSSLGRVIESPNQRFIGEIIQTDAAVNPGNSGGPLLNLAGEVVGVNSAIFSPSGASAGIGFAIPARTVQRVVPALIAMGRYPHPSLGVQLFELTPDAVRLLRHAGMDLPVDGGLLVVETSAATQRVSDLRSGTKQARVGNLIVPIGGDVIIAINGQEVSSFRDMIVYLETQTEVGQKVDVTIIRDGEEQLVEATLLELVQ